MGFLETLVAGAEGLRDRLPAVSGAAGRVAARPQNLLLLWVLTGEIVAALTRTGRMPAMYQSVLVPGARDRNARFAASPFHEAHEVPAIPPGRLGGDYLDRIGAILRGLIEEEAGARIVEVITGDGTDQPPQPDYVIRPRWPFGDAS